MPPPPPPPPSRGPRPAAGQSRLYKFFRDSEPNKKSTVSFCSRAATTALPSSCTPTRVASAPLPRTAAADDTPTRRRGTGEINKKKLKWQHLCFLQVLPSYLTFFLFFCQVPSGEGPRDERGGEEKEGGGEEKEGGGGEEEETGMYKLYAQKMPSLRNAEHLLMPSQEEEERRRREEEHQRRIAGRCNSRP